MGDVSRWLSYLTGGGILSSSSPEIMSKVTMVLLMGSTTTIHHGTKSNKDINPKPDINQYRGMKNEKPKGAGEDPVPIPRGSPEGKLPDWAKPVAVAMGIMASIGLVAYAVKERHTLRDLAYKLVYGEE